MVKKLSKKFQKNAEYPHIPDDFPFSDYITLKQALIRQHRVDLTPENTDTLVQANSPYEWQPSFPSQSGKTRGILLIHGLLDSTYSGREIGQFFRNQGFLVRAILLPGHGTVPGDLLQVTCEDWLEETRYGINSLAKEVDELYVLGNSAGASLALYQALDNPRIKGVFLFAPSIKLLSPLAFAGGILKHLGKIHDAAAWYQMSDDLDYSKYDSFPYQMIEQAYKLTKLIRRKARKHPPTMPLFMVIAEHDETIDSKAAQHFFSQFHHPHSRLIIYGNSPRKQQDARIIYRPCAYPDQGILNFSHVCLTIAPDNPRYGRQGDYQIPHPKNPPNAQGRIYQGSMNGKVPKDGSLFRLTYNPDFPEMLKEVQTFLAE